MGILNYDPLCGRSHAAVFLMDIPQTVAAVLIQSCRSQQGVPRGCAPVRFTPPRYLVLIAEVAQFIQRCAVSCKLHEALPSPLEHRTAIDDSIVKDPNALHNGLILI